VKSVLIAHQSTIPPYRVAFYEAVERMRPAWWRFSVVYDPGVSRRKNFPALDLDRLSFPTVTVSSVRIGNGRTMLQGSPGTWLGHDLLVVGCELSNLSYPLLHLLRLAGTPVACWGQGREKRFPSRSTDLVQAIKLAIARRASGYFAYTRATGMLLARHGVREDRLFDLGNTIDISAERQRYARYRAERTTIRRELGIEHGRALLYVGRIEKRKGLAILERALARLVQLDPSYRLLVVGAGDRAPLQSFDAATCIDLGPLRADELARAYVASDLYVLPGTIGLGPLQALCYDRIPAVIDSALHAPEYEYLSEANALIAPRGSSADDYAAMIHHAFESGQIERRAARAWSTVSHLTIDAMAANFIAGVNSLLASSEGQP